MYEWRKMTPQERQEALETRKQKIHPWHSPPHQFDGRRKRFLLSATCFNHEPLIAHTAERLDEFSELLSNVVHAHSEKIYAWCVLPNHYHVLVQTNDLKSLMGSMGRLHGRTSRAWNLEENRVGRQCWHNSVDRGMRSYRHLMATINYVHHNPVKHGYVERWQDWPWSSASAYLEGMGREKAMEIWRQYPVGDYGEKWDT